MSLWNIFKPKKEKAVLTSAELAELLDGSGSTSNSGQSVSATTAMQCAAVYACIKVLGESIGQLPLKLYERTSSGKNEAGNHNLYHKLKFLPNSWMTRQDFFEYLVTCLCLRGNSYNYINRVSSGKITEIVPLHPDTVTVTQNDDFSLNYVYTAKNKTYYYSQDDIWHIKGISVDGFTGISPITYHKEAIGLSLATERHGANLFSRGGRPSGVLEHPGKLSTEASARISAGWKAAHGGTNQGGTAILEEAMKYNPISMTNEDMQFLETRKYQRSEIASIFRVPPHLIGDLEKSTYSNIEQQSLEFIKYTLMPWLTRIELSIYRDLLTKEEKNKYFAEFLVDGLERGDIKTRYEAYVQGIQNGILNSNEVRAKENLNPRGGGDDYLSPMNMAVNGEPIKDTGKSVSIYQKKDSSPKRHQLRDGYTEAFKKISTSIVKSDVARIRKAAKSHLNKKSLAGFKAWLEEYRETAPANIEKAVLALVQNYGEQIKGAALADVGLGGSDIPDFEKFLSDHAGYFALAYTENGAGQLKALLEGETPLESIEKRLDEWEETRPGKMAEDEVVKLDGLTSKFVWAAAGVTLLKWRNTGGDTCAFCKAMDGKTVGVNANFLDAGAALEVGGEKLKTWKAKAVPPLHSGCKCQIVPTNGS